MRAIFTFLFGMLSLSATGRGEWASGAVHELGRLPGGGIAWERSVTQDGRSVVVSGVSFEDKQNHFRVIDNPPDARVPLAEAVRVAGGVAGINGGYFHPDFTPLGLVISGGKSLHAFQQAKLLSGVLAVRRGRIELVRAGAFKPGKDVTEALQAGPWLRENGAGIAGLDAVRPARRSIVATDGRGRWALLALSPVTLAEAAAILSVGELVPGWTVEDALNLDGGSSTALFAGAEGRVFLGIPSFGPVRNYLAIVPRRP